jgi:hypothetical protein
MGPRPKRALGGTTRGQLYLWWQALGIEIYGRPARKRTARKKTPAQRAAPAMVATIPGSGNAAQLVLKYRK